MNWATFWSGASAVAAVGVLIITAIYAWLTHRLAVAAESQIWESSRARMSVSIGTNQGGQLFLLEFENLGASLAEDLQAKIDKPVHQQLGQNPAITDVPFFKDGIRALPPNRPIKFALGVAFRWLSPETDRALHPDTFDVTVSYRTLGKSVEEIFPIDIGGQFYLTAIDKDYMDEFGRNFPEKFERSMRDIARSIDQAAEPLPELPLGKRSWPAWFSKQVWNDRLYR